MATTRNKRLLLGLLTLLGAGALVASALGAMRSERIDRNLCETTGGARIVDIPGFPGERVDRRLLDDIRLLERRYKIFITDGYSKDPVHASNGEHPIGLALDIVPDTAGGGTWKDVTALAKWAEPRQDHPVAPFRWVGYDGDEGHGRGNHLHLSWNHSESKPGVPPATVYTLRCPGDSAPPSDDDPGGGKPGGEPGGVKPGSGQGGGGPSGGVEPGDPGGSTGGVSVGRAAYERDAQDPVIETGGVGLLHAP